MVPWWMIPLTAIVAGILGALAAYGEFMREQWTHARHGITTARMGGVDTTVQEAPGKRARNFADRHMK